MFLQIYEPELGAMRTIAIATAEEGKQVNLITPLPKEARARIEFNLKQPDDHIVVIDSPAAEPDQSVGANSRACSGWSRSSAKSASWNASTRFLGLS